MYISSRKRRHLQFFFVLVVLGGGVFGYKYVSEYIADPAELLQAVGGGVPRELAQKVRQTESTVRSLRSTQAVLSRREEILRYELRKLEEENSRNTNSMSPRLREELRKSRNTLVVLLRDQQETDQKVTEYLKQMWEAEGRLRVAAMGMNPDAINVFISWPIEPENGISAGYKDSEYETIFGMEHNAVDIPVLQGTEVRAAAAGTVQTVADNGMGYNYVILMHDGFATLYGHLSSFTVSEGQEIAEGEVLALSGGMPGTPGAGAISTGPHVHFELIVAGEHKDPIAYLPFVQDLEIAGAQ
jgi:murein DD-endopeptidase MepM/ murein hydrolase activator NlpD